MQLQKTTTAKSVLYQRPFIAILALYCVIVLPLCFFGYGSDNDTYQVLGAGRLTWSQHVLTTSRIPGYWFYEALVFILNRCGGSLAVNLGSFTMGGLILWRLDRFRTRIPKAAITAASVLLILTPTFEIAASSGDDYLWSALFLVLVLEALLEAGFLRAGLWGALAIAVREANLLLVVGLYVATAIHAWQTSHGAVRFRKIKRLLVAGLLTLGGMLPIYFSYRAAHDSFSFIYSPASDPTLWSLKMRVGRFGYKMLLLFGPFSLIALLFGLRRLPTRLREENASRQASWMCLGGILANLALFFLFPLEVSYLLPGAIFLLIMLAITVLKQNPRLTVALVCCFIFSDLVTLVFAKPNLENRATDAHFTFFTEPGPVFQDFRDRMVVRHCDSLPCWQEKTGQ